MVNNPMRGFWQLARQVQHGQELVHRAWMAGADTAATWLPATEGPEGGEGILTEGCGGASGAQLEGEGCSSTRMVMAPVGPLSCWERCSTMLWYLEAVPLQLCA